MRFSDLRFLLSLVMPSLTVFSLLYAPQNAFFGTLIVWIGIALLDELLPKNSPPPVASGQGAAYFQWILRVYVLLQLTVIAVGAYAAMRSDWLTVLGMGFAAGFISGAQGITFAHELGHSKSKFDRFCGWVLMTSVCYGHFMVEHYRGHHPRAATLEDPASARFGESLYAFLPRTLRGSLVSGWRLEAQRVHQMKSTWGKSPLLWSTLGSIAMLGMPFLMLFWQFAGMESALSAIKIIVYLVFQSIVAFMLLEVVNYIEHYGLSRQSNVQSDQTAKREPFGMLHAWNADHVITNSLLANLQRHSDHHMHAWKPYSTLEAMPQGPQLPTGYAGCLLLAAVPPVWFALMHPRLAALASRPVTV